ncbi:hypothetical protein OROMI_031084 [Orobanche minor]
MGQRHHLVSFLCGVFKKKQPPAKPSAAKQEDGEPEDTPAKPPSAGGSESPDEQRAASEQQQPLPPPPGGLHMRASSCHHHHQRSNSSASKLVSSVSMRVLGSGVVGRQSSRRENKEKKLTHEDSIWKKTIILGEKCKVPDEDDDSILYDEKGNRISTYHHRKSHSGALSFSRQTSCIDHEELSRK